MRFLSSATHNRDRFLLVVAGLLVFALGCQPAMLVDTVLTAKSCTDNAHTMTFVMHSNCAINGAIFQGGTPNVLGIRELYANGTSQNMTCVSELDNAMKNDKVEERFHAGVTIQGTVQMSLADLAFYKGNWQDPGSPDCNVVHSPEYTVTYVPAPGTGGRAVSPASLSVQVSDPYPLPMSLVELDMVQAPAVMDASLLDWDNASFNALPWTSAAPGGTLLSAAAPPLNINLPDTATGKAVLCRFISLYDGMEVRGIMQLSLIAPLAARSSTWGGVKSLFRG